MMWQLIMWRFRSIVCSSPTQRIIGFLVNEANPCKHSLIPPHLKLIGQTRAGTVMLGGTDWLCMTHIVQNHETCMKRAAVAVQSSRVDSDECNECSFHHRPSATAVPQEALATRAETSSWYLRYLALTRATPQSTNDLCHNDWLWLAMFCQIVSGINLAFKHRHSQLQTWIRRARGILNLSILCPQWRWTCWRCLACTPSV